ncbi:MAG: NAD-binding protein [Myxococcota bacterium]|nr:NAD-binding protein [Myxococcota bacterium]
MPSELVYILGQQEMRRNLRALASYFGLLIASMALSTVLFHLIMVYEGQQHSWLTGLYWTLTVMSTLGFGDITFNSDLGRGFTIVVLIWGIVMLLIVLPFTFIRFFYAPWLEAQVRLRAPREAPEDVENHVIICHYEEIAAALIDRLEELGIDYFVIEPDPERAAQLHGDGVSVVTAMPEVIDTYRALRIDKARLVLANRSDATNTNIILTIRELASEVPIVALAASADSVDLLQLSGATHALPLKDQLGEHLASRVTVGTRQAHRIGRFEDLRIAEFPINGTKLPGKTVRESRLRELTGLSIVGVWEGGALMAAEPDTLLSEHSVPVIVGTEEQLTELDSFFTIYQANENPVLVIGGGTVGRSTAATLHEREAKVTILDSDASLEASLQEVSDKVIVGDGANLDTILKAGLLEAPSVLLTTNNDATNIYLAVYCRKLNSDAHIVSRITHEWNLPAIRRAGADFALSHVALAVKTIVSLIEQRELVIIGEGTELFIEPVPRKLAGKPLSESGIGAKTGLNVVAVRNDGESLTNPPATTELPGDGTLVMIGTPEQHRSFLERYAKRKRDA